MKNKHKYNWTWEEKYKFVRQAALGLTDARNIYICARNKDAGLVDLEVQRKIEDAILAIKKQLDYIYKNHLFKNE